MRRKDLEVLDKERLIKVLDGCKVCRLGISDEVPYIVPMNFGYSWDGRLTLYFHSAPRGRKIDLLKQRPKVSFEMDCDHQLVAGSTACRYSYRYSCLMGAGEVRFLEDVGEKLEALRRIAVFAVDATEVIGKIR